MKKNIIYGALALTIAATAVSCNRFLDITPVGLAIPKTVEDYRGLMTRAYSLYPAHRAVVEGRTDNVLMNTSSSYAPTYKDIYLWNDSSSDPATAEIPYGAFYSVIFYTNHVINNGSVDMPESAEKNQILGEAYALRAYCFFELANLYAPEYSSANVSAHAIPLVTEIDLEKDYPKATVQQVYDQILSDVAKAESLVNVASQATSYNYRFSTTAINAFKARIYQYMGNWQSALVSAEKVLAANSKLEDFSKYTVMPSSFKSVESIMNLDINLNSGTQSAYRASQQLLSLYDQSNDLRFSKYFRKSGSLYQSTKYSSSNEFKTTFRVGEIVLLKAEAEAKLGKTAESKQALLSLASKRYNATGLANFTTKISALSGDNYLAELYNERNRELAFEGLRWYDLRRTSKPTITHQYSTETATLQQNDPRYTLPFPKSAKLKNPQL